MGEAAGRAEAAVRAEGLVKTYGRTPALRGLDLEVRRGEIFGFIGPNGAGKTTTIRIMLDLVRPTSGRLEVFGSTPLDGGPALRRRIAYLPGDLRLHDRGSVADVVGVFAAMRYSDGAERRTTRERAASLCRRLDLDPSRQVRALSKGNRQKVGIVLALMHEAELLVLDEPTSGLDPLVQQEVLSLLREQRDAGRTVFMSSHVLSEVEDVADRVGIIRSGQMVDVDDMTAVRGRAARIVEIRFAAPVTAAEFAGIPGVASVEVDGTGTVLRCSVAGAMDALLRATAVHTIVDLLSRAPDLEDLFLTFYGGPDGRADAPPDGRADAPPGALRPSRGTAKEATRVR